MNDAFTAFVYSLSTVPSTSSLSIATSQRSLQQRFLLLCSRESLNGSFYLFSAIQKCYSEGTLNLTEPTFSWNKPFRLFRKFPFRNIQERIIRKANVVAPNLGNVLGRKCM